MTQPLAVGAGATRASAATRNKYWHRYTLNYNNFGHDQNGVTPAADSLLIDFHQLGILTEGKSRINLNHYTGRYTQGFN